MFFALARGGIAVGIHPYTQFGEYLIAFIYNVVAVGVILRKRLKAVLCIRAVGKCGAVTEKLSAIVNFAVAVKVETEETVGRSLVRVILVSNTLHTGLSLPNGLGLEGVPNI